MTTLIYGVTSVSGQTEYSLKQIADHVREEKPDLAKLLTDVRYVDNLLDSVSSIDEAKKLAEETSEVLDRLSLPTKVEDPKLQETINSNSIDVNGMK